jgi:hypothetical protein
MKPRIALVAGLAWLAVLAAPAAIPVGLSPQPFTFDTLPSPSEWATLSLPGGGGFVTAGIQLDALVQTNSAAGITNQLLTTQTVPPTASGVGRWNSPLQLMQTRPAGVTAILLMATLQNETGGGVSQVTVQYDFGIGFGDIEEVSGYQVYYSQTGGPGTWIRIPELSTRIVAGVHAAVVAIEGGWAANAPLYLLWADDNTDGATDPHLTIDNFTASAGICDSFYGLQPFNDVTVTEGQPASFTIDLCPHEQFDFQWYKDGNAIPGATNDTIVFPRAQLTDAGTYYNSFSRHATLMVLPDEVAPRAHVAWQREENNPLTDLVMVRFSEPIAPDRIGDTANYQLASGSNAAVSIYFISVTNETNVVLEVEPLQPDAPCFLTISNLVDQSAAANLLSPNPTVLEVQRWQPPIVGLDRPWKYFEAPSNTATLTWTEPNFDDSAWLTGLPVFGFPSEETLPEPYSVQTVIRCASCGGPNTTWFRTLFTLLPQGTNAVVQLEGVFDDGAVVYLNGTEVWRVRLPAGSLTTDIYALNSPEPHSIDGPIEVYAPDLLRAGTNILAVALHQSSFVNGDVFMGLTARITRGALRPRLQVVAAPGNTVTVRWNGAGTLQASSDVHAPPDAWQDIATTTNSFTTNIATGTLFFRVRL